MSSLGIFNKETKTYQKVAGTAEAAVVDAEMSDTSTNTVQNKVIKKYVDDSNANKLDKASVVDNQITSEAGYALDARQANPNVDGSLGAQIKTVNETVNTLKKSVSDGKTLVATAITAKGVETAADATFAVMAENISQIETGGGELHGATISVTTTESTLIGKTIKLSLNSTTVDTKTFDDNGACSFTDIQEAGTYSLYSTDGTDSATIPVDVTAENVVNKTVISCEFYLTPDGETITPVDDVAILLKCAEIKDKSYTTMDELLADDQAMGDITMSENAMKYLARSTGFADAVCANETFMTLLGQSAYVDATVLNSDLWVEAICNSAHVELIYTDLVPTMTSDTSPSGICTAFSVKTHGGSPYLFFDKNTNTIFDTNYGGASHSVAIENFYIGYEFPQNTVPKVLYLWIDNTYIWGIPKTMCVEFYSEEESKWVNIKTFSIEEDYGFTMDTVNIKKPLYVSLNNNNSAKKWRIRALSKYDGVTAFKFVFYEVSFFGR